MSEYRGRSDHGGVISAPIHFEVGPTSQRGPNAHANLSGIQGRGLDVFYPHIFAAI